MSLHRKIIHLVGKKIQKVLRIFGYDIVSFSPHTRIDVRMYWINKLGIDLLLDVGANEGQFVGWMRQRGYEGSIISFEPQSSAFSLCQKRWKNDANWHGVHAALGEETGEVEMHIAGNSVSSSILPMLDSHVNALPQSAIVDKEQVKIMQLDQQISELGNNAKFIYLKIDTQGYEIPVLKGCSDHLQKVAFIELELSLVELYDGQELLPEVLTQVQEMGFTPVWLEQGFSDAESPRMLQVDGFFVNTNMLGGNI